MAERIADNAELIVDEMRRKARRRLVGAIVLALAVAIVVPMLLEKDPKPLGDDVSVQIPPIDQSKFVNRLTGKAGDSKAPPKSESKPVPTGTAKPEASVETPASATPAPPARTETAIVPKAEATAPPKAEAAAAPKAEAPAPAMPGAKSETKSAPRSDAGTAADPGAGSRTAVATTAPAAVPAQPAAAPATAKADGYVVQLAAFADDKGANALANKLKKGGYAAYVEPVNTSRGTLWRVRVGGYGTRPEADAARVALKGEGYSGIIAPSQ